MGATGRRPRHFSGSRSRRCTPGHRSRFAGAVSRMLLVAAERIPELENVPDEKMNTLQERIEEGLARALPPKPPEPKPWERHGVSKATWYARGEGRSVSYFRKKVLANPLDPARLGRSAADWPEMMRLAADLIWRDISVSFLKTRENGQRKRFPPNKRSMS